MEEVTGGTRSGGDGAALALRGVRFGYEADRPVIDGLSGELLPGRLYALIGPNAAGKSTLLRLMLGHFEPWQGHIEVGGHPLRSLSPLRRARLLSYVPQRSGARFAYTVEQVVAMGRFAVGPDPAAIDQTLARCELQPLRHRVFAELSVGQQQRVLLARAIAQAVGGGVAVLLDEPTSALDLRHVHQTMTLLTQLKAQGMAVLVVLHDLNLAARYADEVWLLDGGRFVARGGWRQVLRPEVLEPIYRVALVALASPDDDRPVFCTRRLDTLTDA